MKRRWIIGLFVLLAGAVPIAMAQGPLKVALIIAQGGLGDLSYNDLAYQGLQKAAKDFAGKIEVRAVQSNDIVSQGESVLRSAAKAGFNLVIDLEFSTADALKRVAPDYPNTQFAILNTVVDEPNVTSVMFGEQQGSYLAGALAAMVTEDPSIKGINDQKVIGVIGGTKSLGIDKFIVGYIEGAHYIDPSVKVLTAYANSFGDPAKGKQMTQAMFEQGADIVYQVAGGTGQGVIDAAKESGHFAIGVDTDQDYLAPGNVLTSMVKHSDIAVYNLIQEDLNGSLKGGTIMTLDLAAGGVGLSPMRYTKDMIPAKDITKLDQIRAGILDGSIKPTDITAVSDPQAVLQRLGIGQ
jgi:basic membrane protein A